MISVVSGVSYETGKDFALSLHLRVTFSVDFIVVKPRIKEVLTVECGSRFWSHLRRTFLNMEVSLKKEPLVINANN